MRPDVPRFLYRTIGPSLIGIRGFPTRRDRLPSVVNPVRVVSLLPSATESLMVILRESGGESVHLVGRSHECDWPADGSLDGIPVLTGSRTTFTTAAAVDQAVRAQFATGQSLYTLDTHRLAELRPDVILTQDLCRVCSIDLATVRGVVESMPAEQRPRVVSLNPMTFEAVLDDVLIIGQAIGLEREALNVVVRLRERIARAEEQVTPYLDGPKVAFLEWTDPLFIGGHWTPQLIERAGGRHLLNPTVAVEGSGAAAGPIGQTMRAAGKSVRIPAEVLAASRPEALIICPCGLTLEQAWHETERLARQPWWPDLPAVRGGRVAVVDGNQFFNRPGPRLVDALEWLAGWLNDRPEVMPREFGWRVWQP